MDILIADQNGLIYVNSGVKNGIPRFRGPEGVSTAGGIYLVSCPAVDYDRDGRLDLLGAQWYAWAPSPLLRNVTREASHYINVAMDLGTHPNRNGIGARVCIYEPGRSGDPDALLGVKIISVSYGYSSGQEAMVHFGVLALRGCTTEGFSSTARPDLCILFLGPGTITSWGCVKNPYPIPPDPVP